MSTTPKQDSDSIIKPQNNQAEPSLGEKLNAETAKIPWRELQRFFASGMAIGVDETLDLLDIAALMTADNAQQIKQFMDAGKLDVVSDAQALAWYERDAKVWAVVIKPWVLVQGLK